jgi:hypothetical protein
MKVTYEKLKLSQFKGASSIPVVLILTLTISCLDGMQSAL